MTVPRNRIMERLNTNVDNLLEKSAAETEKWLAAEVRSTFRSTGDSGAASPFIKSMFPEIKLASILERSLGTRLGWGWDKMVADIAQATWGNGKYNHKVRQGIPVNVSNTIDAFIASYTDSPRTVPDTGAELAAILPGVPGPGATVDLREKSDAHYVDAHGVEHYVEMKTPKPNYDQLRNAKRRILRLHAMRVRAGVQQDKVRAFVGMPYNPNGRHGNYGWPTTPIFLDMLTDLKIGPDFWNYLGDSPDTYDELLDCFYEVGRNRRAQLLTLL